MNKHLMIPSNALGSSIAFAAIAALILSTGRLNSQYAAPGTLPPDVVPAALLPKTPEAVMYQVKAANAAVLQKQEATMQRIDAIQLEADQLRIYSRRG